MQLFAGFVCAFVDYLQPHITTPMPLPKVCWSGNEVYTSLPLHPYHSIATLEWHCSVNLHICDALQCHFGSTLRCISNATPKVHPNTTPEFTLHCHSVITTPMSLRSAFVVYIMVCGDSTPHRYYKDTLVPLPQGKGIYDRVSENMTFHYATKTIFSKWQYLLFWRDQYNMYIVNDIRGSASNIYCYSPRDLISRWVYGFIWLWSIRLCSPGPCLNIKTVFPRYGDSLVKDKTVDETVLSLTWESLYL